MGVNAIRPVGQGDERPQGILGSKRKVLDEQLSGALSGSYSQVAYMPAGGIGSLLNGKGVSQAATDV